MGPSKSRHAETVSFRPKALVAPIGKDPSTLQYYITLALKTPLRSERLVFSLGGSFLGIDSDTYVSSTYRHVQCRTSQCVAASSGVCCSCGTCSGPRSPSCGNNTCVVGPYNPFISTSTSGDVLEDVLAIHSTDGKTRGPPVSVPHFVFSGAGAFLTKGLTASARGVAGLGRGKVGLPAQLSAKFRFRRKFAVCLSGSSTSPGVVFFGPGPYVLQPDKDVSQGLTYTPLLLNPVSTSGAFFQGQKSDEYFIEVKGFNIGEKPVVGLISTLLKIDSEGDGGTKISTVDPYTMLETSIYKAVTSAFVQQAIGIGMERVSGVKPFEVCFSAKGVPSTRLGPAVPTIELLLDNGKVWGVFGANSMVFTSNGALCLGLVDGGVSPRTSIFIGAHQIEDDRLEFDLAYSRLGFWSSLLALQTTCANFKF
ncbi:hypothetical protein AMTR_s00025p00079520 [Amborella trichopoda]|uniref:Peptidase A1 domain-containing protein n=1 Tax=Amborella trichopoda TaxID=13333 RepID=W1PY05_AMBTC|nr:hypothetical protein AMTR_s00025p00079520 [Amborella trichopoda]